MDNQILDTLFERHYELWSMDENVSSSHWRKYGAATMVQRTIDGYKLAGAGFGSFIPDKGWSLFKNAPSSFLALRLMERCKPYPEVHKAGLDVAIDMGRLVDFDCVKQILSLDLLSKMGVLRKCETICVIGDGYGYMTALVQRLMPRATVICVNLGRMLFFDAYYVQKALRGVKCALWDKSGGPIASVGFIEANNAEMLYSWRIDLFINIASMQEMDMPVIENYFRLMRSGQGERYFYCCNRVRKVLPDGSIIDFNQYPWKLEDEILLDEPCPWYTRYPINRPPFWREFKGIIKHRIAKLAAA